MTKRKYRKTCRKIAGLKAKIASAMIEKIYPFLYWYWVDKAARLMLDIEDYEAMVGIPSPAALEKEIFGRED